MKLEPHTRDELGGAVYSGYGSRFDHLMKPGAYSDIGFRIRGILAPELIHGGRGLGEIGAIRVTRLQLVSDP